MAPGSQTPSRTAVNLTPELIGERLAPVLRRYSVVWALVFGSVARGEASRRSDVDVLVVQETDKRFLDRYDGLLMEMSDAVPEAPLEALVYTPAEMVRMSGEPFIARALREGKVVYERD